MIFLASRTSMGGGDRDRCPIEGATFHPGSSPDWGEWQIEINTLEELLDAIRKNDNGSIKEAVISLSNGKPPKLEIYDDYRE